MTVLPHHRIAVWFSCGAASAVALKLTVDRYGVERVLALNTPIAEEHPDNRRFLADVAAWVGIPIQEVIHPDFPSSSCVEVWDKRSFMSSPYGAPCTLILKKQARQEWEKANPVDWHVLGFTAEETARHERFVLTERDNVLPVLIEEGYDKAECMGVIQKAGIALPAIYAEGFPNANCIGCVKSSSPDYWNLVRRTHPDVFNARAEQSRRIGARLVEVKGERLFLDHLPETAKGRGIPQHMPDCGLFCEERLPFRKKPKAEVPA